MSRELIHKREDILGTIFLVDQIKNDEALKTVFNQGITLACEKLEILTEDYEKVSKTSFRRLFKIIEEPKISFETLNKVVLWFSKRKYQTFREYVRNHHKEIVAANLVSDEVLEAILEKVKGEISNNEATKLNDKESKKSIFFSIKNPIQKNMMYALLGFIGFLLIAIIISKFYFDKKPSEHIFNISIKNTPNNKELSIFIFDSIPKIDHQFTGQLMAQSKLKDDYLITPLLISEAKLDKDIIDKLKSGNFNFPVNIKDHTDYICVGTVAYSFRENKIVNDRITCTMTVYYTIRSVVDGTIIDSYSKTIIGNGRSRQSAKINTIKKFML